MRLTTSHVYSAMLFATVPLCVAQPTLPVVSPVENIRHMTAEVDGASSYSLRPDGKGPYRWEEKSRVFGNGLALFLCTEVKTCSTLPQTAPASTDANRVLLVDLTHPADEHGKKLGLLRLTDVTMIIFWEQDKTQRMIYSKSGIEGYMTRDLNKMPVGETHASERMELRFFLDGSQHILQFGPWTAGQFQKTQGPFNGAGTTQATISRVDEGHYTVRSGNNSVGRLWDNGHPDHPVDRGLYSFSFDVRFSAAPQAQ